MKECCVNLCHLVCIRLRLILVQVIHCTSISIHSTTSTIAFTLDTCTLLISQSCWYAAINTINTVICHQWYVIHIVWPTTYYSRGTGKLWPAECLDLKAHSRIIHGPLHTKFVHSCITQYWQKSVHVMHKSQHSFQTIKRIKSSTNKTTLAFGSFLCNWSRSVLAVFDCMQDVLVVGV